MSGYAVALREQGNRRPLFLVPEITGDVSSFLPLSRHMQEGIPVYGLPVVADSGLTSLEDLAAQHVAAMRKIQPGGPYRLAGYSFGGVLAYEMATQLIGNDEEVEFLGLIDADCSTPDPRRSNEASKLTANYNALPALWAHYDPQPLSVLGHSFIADDCSEDHSRGWQSLFGNHLHIEKIDGTRIGMIQEPHVAKLATVLSQAITAAERRPANNLDRDYTAIFPLHMGKSSAPPIFCFPGAGANVTSFLALTEVLGEQTSIYGVQPRGLEGRLVPHASVVAAATSYVKAMQALRPNGPYRLVGHSFGGWIAYEVACQLSAQKAQVDTVVMLDTESPTDELAVTKRLTRVEILMKLVALFEQESGRKFSLSTEDLAKLDSEAQLKCLLQAMISAGLLSRRSTVETLRGLVRVFTVNVNTTYTPVSRFSGRILLLQAQEDSSTSSPGEAAIAEDNRNFSRAWQKYAEQVITIEMPCNHMNMLKRPSIDKAVENMWRLWKEPPSPIARI